MTTLPDTPYSRRQFIEQGVTLASLATTVPYFLQESALGMLRPAGSQLASQPGVPEDRVLVVVQLGGGNDGLNTVIPYSSPDYYNARPNLAVPAPGRSNGAALQFDQSAGIGLHPNLTGLKELLDDGVASVVQGVGYPNPNRSHFTSMDIWHTADTSGRGQGWLGRYFDNTCNGQPQPEAGISIGREAPQAMIGKTQKPVTFESAELFKWSGGDVDETLRGPYDEINRIGKLQGEQSNLQLGYLTRTALDAQVASDRIRKAVAQKSLVQYPHNSLAHQLKIVGAMIRAGLSTRVYYVTLGGFDTHAAQPGTHANLLRRTGDSLNAFYKDLKVQGNNQRVLTMVFSEFGRRVGENGSRGTDHGTAAPMYFIGDMVKPGLLGMHPSLTDLDNGDLKYNVDFRSLYAGVLYDWMGAEPETILGDTYRNAEIITAEYARSSR